MPPVQLKLSWRTYSVRLVFTCGSLRPSQPAHVRRRGALVFSAADRNCATTPIARRPSETARHTANSSRMPIIFRTPLKTACIRPNSFPDPMPSALYGRCRNRRRAPALVSRPEKFRGPAAPSGARVPLQAANPLKRSRAQPRPLQ
jgi:hypothetical protein